MHAMSQMTDYGIDPQATAPADWTAQDLERDRGWVFRLDDTARRDLAAAVRRAYDPARTLLDYRRDEFDLGAAAHPIAAAVAEARRGRGLSLVKDTMQSFSYSMQQAPPSSATVDLSILAYPGPMADAEKWNLHNSGDIIGIVMGMLAFVGLVAMFVHRIRQGSASSAAGPGDIIVGAVEAGGKKTRQQGKLGVEVRGADSA